MSHETDPPPVGYKNPPHHTRFKKGQSGNPAGRRKAKPVIPNLSEALITILSEPISFNTKGKSKNITLFEGLLRRMIEKAFNGDASARKEIFRMLEQAKTGPSEANSDLMEEQEQQLLANFLARSLRAGGGVND